MVGLVESQVAAEMVAAVPKGFVELEPPLRLVVRVGLEGRRRMPAGRFVRHIWLASFVA